jgi:hypothetical protein
MDDRKLEVIRPAPYAHSHAYDRPYWVEPKYNGRWVRLTNIGGGPIRCHGHRQNDMGHLTYLDIPQDVIGSWFKMPRETALDTEFIWPGHHATEVITAIVSCPDQLVCKPFSSPWFLGHDLRKMAYVEGRDYVRHYIPLVPMLYCFDTRPSLGEALAMVQKGEEGVVLKGAWYDDWWKVKPLSTVDAFITRLNYGTAGKWRGVPNSIRVAVHAPHGVFDIGTVGIFKSCGGKQGHEIIASLSASDIGRTVEVEYQALTSGFKLQHAKFIGWREDKRAEDCNVTQFDAQIEAQD